MNKFATVFASLCATLFAVFPAFAPVSRAASVEPSSLAGRWIAVAKARGLSHETEWLRLLNYEQGWFGADSPARGPLFFLAPGGATDPEAELEATLRGFFRKPTAEEDNPNLQVRVPGQPERQAPQCQFPARLMWLQRQLGFKSGELPRQNCARYRRFVQTLGARSVTLVFSSYYLNNPSSAFGHTFLRLNRGIGAKAGEELLDYGINYAATVDTGNALLYGFKGLAGLFPGTFTSVPYYYKIREYNDFESRDLWEYDLSFTPQQTAFLVAHLWEMGSTWLRYFYTSKNCSYEILYVLDAVDPKLHLIDQLSSVVIPADTVKTLFLKPGFVTAVHYRPSIRTQFQYRLSRLSPEEQKALHEILDARNGKASGGAALKAELQRVIAGPLPVTEKVAVLDAAADYIDQHYSDTLVKQEGKHAQEGEWKQEILLARSQILQASPPITVPPPWTEMPQLGHGSRRVTLGTGYGGRFGSITTLEYRLALHDLTDPTPGYPTYAQMEMGKLRVRYNSSPSSFWLDNFTVFRVLSLNPLQAFNHQFSWNVALEAKRFYDGICQGSCFGGSFEAGGGYAVDLSSAVPLTAYLLASGEFIASPSFPGAHFRPGVGPTFGVRWHPTDTFGTALQSGYRYRFLAGPHDASFAEWVTRWEFRPDLALAGQVSQYFPDYVEGTLGVSYYY